VSTNPSCSSQLHTKLATTFSTSSLPSYASPTSLGAVTQAPVYTPWKPWDGVGYGHVVMQRVIRIRHPERHPDPVSITHSGSKCVSRHFDVSLVHRLESTYVTYVLVCTVKLYWFRPSNVLIVILCVLSASTSMMSFFCISDCILGVEQPQELIRSAEAITSKVQVMYRECRRSQTSTRVHRHLRLQALFYYIRGRIDDYPRSLDRFSVCSRSPERCGEYDCRRRHNLDTLTRNATEEAGEYKWPL